MNHLFFIAIPILFLSGCITSSSLLDAKGIWRTPQSTLNSASEDRRQAIVRGDFSSLIRAYEIQKNSERDDSAYVSQSALNEVASMVSCPPLSDTSGLGKYSAQPILDTSRMAILVKVNRPNCSVDLDSVRARMDALIAANRSARLESARREKEAREADPRGPYFMGCTDYQKFVRGETSSNQPNPKEAIERHPKVNAAYASRLYVTGWEDARAYGVRSVNCGYLTQINIAR